MGAYEQGGDGEGGGRGEGESMKDLGKGIDYLLIFVSEWMSGD